MNADGLSYVDGVSYAVSGIGTCTDTDVVIASEYEGLPVTSIGDSAFYDCSKLASVNIPDSVTSVGDSAFYGCTSLTSVEIPNATSIGKYAFEGCQALASVNLPVCHYVGAAAFRECPSLTSVNLPSTENGRLYPDAFYGCTSLTSIDLFNKTIDEAVFYGCTALDTVILRGSLSLTMVTAFLNTKILTAEGMPTGEGFIYVHTSLYEQYVSHFVEQVMAGGHDEATATYLVTAVLRKIEDYPEICG